MYDRVEGPQGNAIRRVVIADGDGAQMSEIWAVEDLTGARAGDARKVWAEDVTETESDHTMVGLMLGRLSRMSITVIVLLCLSIGGILGSLLTCWLCLG